jgi:TusA-related sulfurtransferase
MTIDARRLSTAEGILLTGYAIKKVGSGEIVVLVDDDHAGEGISHTAVDQGWMLKGIESEGDCCRISISKHEG